MSPSVHIFTILLPISHVDPVFYVYQQHQLQAGDEKPLLKQQ